MDGAGTSGTSVPGNQGSQAGVPADTENAGSAPAGDGSSTPGSGVNGTGPTAPAGDSEPTGSAGPGGRAGSGHHGAGHHHAAVGASRRHGDGGTPAPGRDHGREPNPESSPGGPLFTTDDVINFHFMLEDDEALAAFLSSGTV